MDSLPAELPWSPLLGIYPESESEVTQSCLTLCNPVDCSLSGSSVHGIFQAKYWSGLPLPSPRGSSWPRDRTWVFRIAGWLYTLLATREAPTCLEKTIIQKDTCSPMFIATLFTIARIWKQLRCPLFSFVPESQQNVVCLCSDFSSAPYQLGYIS